MMTKMVRELLVSFEKRINIKQNILPRLKNRRFWRDSGLLMLANLIVVGLGLIRTPAMTWILPKDEVGMLGVVASWLPFLQLLSLPGLDGASYHYVAKGQPWAYVVNLTHRLRWSLLSTIGFLVGAAYWGWRGDTSLAWMFVIAGLSFPLTAGLTASAGMLGAQEKYIGLFWYRIANSVVRFAGFIPLVAYAWWMSKVFIFFSMNQVASAILQVIISVCLVRQLRTARTPHMPSEKKREMLKYSKHLTAMNGISVFQSRTEAFLVGALLTFNVMADYSIASLIYDQLKRMWTVFYTIRYPKLVRLQLGKRRWRVLVEGSFIWIGFAGLGILLSILSHSLIPIILPSNYTSSLRYVDWLILAFIISIPGFMSELYFRTQQDERRLYILRGSAAIIGVASSVILISSFGTDGVAIGRFLSGAMLSFLGVILFLREYSYVDSTKNNGEFPD